MTPTHWIILKMRNFWKKVIEKIKTRILLPKIFFPENRAVYEIMSKNMVEPERPQMTIWRRAACRISTATRAETYARARAHTHTYTHTHTHTHTRAQKYVTLIAFPQQQWFGERTSLLRYTYIFSLVLWYPSNVSYPLLPSVFPWRYLLYKGMKKTFYCIWQATPTQYVRLLDRSSSEFCRLCPMRLNLSLSPSPSHMHIHLPLFRSQSPRISEVRSRNVCFHYSSFYCALLVCFPSSCGPEVIRGEANWSPSSAHTGSHTEHECKHSPFSLWSFSNLNWKGLILTSWERERVRERRGGKSWEANAVSSGLGEKAKLWKSMCWMRRSVVLTSEFKHGQSHKNNTDDWKMF